MSKDYYQILGVTRSASGEEIKKAYRRLAHQYHPDKPGGDEKKFKEINEAYQVLSDITRRTNYDRFGSADPAGGFGGFRTSGFSGGMPHGWDGFDFEGQNFGNMGDLGDIFESFFDGMGGRSRRKTYERGMDLEVREEITLEEAFRGVAKTIRLKTFVQCTKCGGKGAEAGSGFEKCAACDGQGEVREQRRSFFGNFAQVKICGKCHGTGEIPKKSCATCKGSGRVESDRDVKVELLPGIEDDQLIKIKGMGEAGERGTASGDLYVRVRIKPHHLFVREGINLIVPQELKIVDLLLGKKVEVPTISGGRILVEIPTNFNLKENLRIPNEGMPRFGASFGGRGDLYVSFIIKAPKKINAKLKKLLSDLEEWHRGEQ